MSYYKVAQLKDRLWYILVPAPGPTLSGRGLNWVTPSFNFALGGPWASKQQAQQILQRSDLPKVSWSAC
jgi:hypothetical protein